MSQLEARVEKLESEVFSLRQLVHKKDEIKHKVWNDMQEGIHGLCQKNHDELVAFRGEVSLRFDQVNQRFEQQENKMNQRFEQMEDRMNQRFKQMEDRFERLEHLIEKALTR